MNDNTQEPIEPQDLFDRKWVKVGLFAVIPVAVFILVCAGIRVSQYGINHTIVVLGQRQLQAGAPAAIRVTLIADGEGFFLPESLDGYLIQGERREEIFHGSVKDAGYALARNFKVPELSLGPAVLELDVRFDERRRIVRADVEIVEEPPGETLFVPGDAAPQQVPVQIGEEGYLLQAFTEDRGAPTGFTSVLFFRALDGSGAPVVTELELGVLSSSSEKKQEKGSTDRLGLMAVPIKPFDLDYPVEIIGGKVNSDPVEKVPDGGVPAPSRKAYIFPTVIYGGIYAAVQNPIVDFNDPIRITVRQLSKGGPLYVDVFQEGRWVQANSQWFSGDGTAQIEIRPPVKGLVRLQITNSALSGGKTVAIRHAFITDEKEDINGGLRDVLGMMGHLDRSWADAVSKMHLEGGAGFDRRMTAAFVMSRLYAGHQVVERIVSSRKEDDEELGKYKAGFQRGVMIIIMLLGLSVALLIGMIARQAQRRQSRLTLMIMAEDDGEDETELMSRPEAAALRRRMIFQGIVLLLIVLGAFASIALLIDVMKWGGR